MTGSSDRSPLAAGLAAPFAAAALLLASILGATPLTPPGAAAAAATLPEIFDNGSEDTVVEGDPGDYTRVFLRFGRTGDLSAPSTVTLTLIDGTAERGTDYTSSAYTKVLEFPAGADSLYTFVDMARDYVAEPDETFSWHLSDPTNATIRTGSADGTVVIRDDDSAAPPTFSVGNSSDNAENNYGTNPAEFYVKRSGSLAAAAWVTVTTVDGTARAPGDYKKRSTTLYFAPGADLLRVLVPITNDLVPESEETFSVRLSRPMHATIADGTGIATIADDDTSDPPYLQIFDDTTSEGDGYAHAFTIVVNRRDDLRGTTTVAYETSDGTAHAPGDYLARTGRLTFLPGQIFKSFTVIIKGDRSPDQDPLKHFFVTLSDSSPGTTIPDPTAQISIEDDD